MNETLREHIESCRQGNRDAFGYIYAQYQMMVHTLAFRLLADEEDAKDATQETFVKVWRQLGRYLPEYKFSTWVYKIATNVCYDKLRGRRKVPKVDVSGYNLSSEATSDSLLDNETLRGLILKTTEGLSQKQKLVFTLSDLEELDVDEIVTVTGLGPAKIKSNLYLARKHIKAKLSNNER